MNRFFGYMREGTFYYIFTGDYLIFCSILVFQGYETNTNWKHNVGDGF